MSPIYPVASPLGETRELIQDASEFHLVGCRERGLSVPDAVWGSEPVEIAA